MGPTSPRDAAELRQAVAGGVPSGAERDAVVLLYSYGPKAEGTCSGTLIAPNLVVTARHCVSSFQEGTVICSLRGNVDTTRPRNPANAGEFGALHAPEQVLVYGGSDPDLDEPASRGKQLWAPETDTICRNDIAFVLLEHELPLPVASVRFGRGVARGEHTLVVGYGANDANTTERHERGGVEVLDVGESDFGPATGLAPPRTFVVGPSACQGDSGGPALSAAGAVLGVSSWGRGDCSSSEARNFYVQLGAFEDLARVVFEASGHDPVLEPEERNPGEGGGAGTAGEAGAIEKSRPALQQEAGCTWSPGPRRGEPTRGHARRVAEGRGSETRGEHASDRQRGVPSVWSWWWLAFGGLALWRRLA